MDTKNLVWMTSEAAMRITVIPPMRRAPQRALFAILKLLAILLFKAIPRGNSAWARLQMNPGPSPHPGHRQLPPQEPAIRGSPDHCNRGCDNSIRARRRI